MDIDDKSKIYENDEVETNLSQHENQKQEQEQKQKREHQRPQKKENQKSLFSFFGSKKK